MTCGMSEPDPSVTSACRRNHQPVMPVVEDVYATALPHDNSLRQRNRPFGPAVTPSGAALIPRVTFHGEFDPGSGRTLAACLTHASGATNQGLPWGKAANG